MGIGNSSRPLLPGEVSWTTLVFHKKNVQWEGSTIGIQQQCWSVPHMQNGTGIKVWEPDCLVWEPRGYARGSLYGVRKGCRCDDRRLCRSKTSNKITKCTGLFRGCSVVQDLFVGGRSDAAVPNESKLPLFIPTACRKEIGGFRDFLLPFSLSPCNICKVRRSFSGMADLLSPFHFVLSICSCLQFCGGCNSHLL